MVNLLCVESVAAALDPCAPPAHPPVCPAAARESGGKPAPGTRVSPDGSGAAARRAFNLLDESEYLLRFHTLLGRERCPPPPY